MRKPLSGLVRFLNEFVRAVRALLKKGLSVQSNLNAQVLTTKVNTPTSGTAWPADVPKFKSELRGRCIGVLPLSGVELDSSNTPKTDAHAGLGVPTWRESEGSDGVRRIQIDHQAGLDYSKAYRLTWLALGE
jgi:hypothetical protein